ncbi:hypothetical protein GGH99_002791 [Coemansia sp. RSA 1285]|nr:hypothetical protein GGH99_002791 [Coemansia sp. RSA 1285]
MFYNTLVLTVLALLVSIAHGLSVRDTTSDIASTKGGILVKNGKQTSCELGVINSKAAFVAAYCIDFSGKTVNQDTEYEVYLDAGIDNTPAKYSVESIAVHPDFNATNGLNPIAVLQFNKDSTETWSNPIAIDRNNSWGDVLFIRQISSTKGGVLVKNGKQTSCELGVIDSRAAFVAAPCLDYSSGNSVDQSTKYEVYLDAGIDNIAAKYTVTSITVHPGYNAETNANPVAILQFNKDSTASWSNPIAIDRKNSWGDSLFIRRGLLDIDAMEWNTPATITNYLDDTALCSYYSRLFKTNTDSFLCSNATTSPPYTYLTGCSIPYGSVDVYISGKLHVAGVYAYTAVSSVGILLACLSLFLYKRWRRAHKDIYKDKDAQMHMQTMLVVDANADYSMPSTTSLVISEPTQPPAPSLHSNVSRDPFYDMDYDLPPLYERNAQTTTSITIDHPY